MNQERLLKVLLSPHVSEKSAVAADAQSKYVFKVTTDATKPEIKSAVEWLFKVDVTGVQVSNMKGKTKGTGPRQGRRADWKKAYVTLKSGQEIDFMSAD